MICGCRKRKFLAPDDGTISARARRLGSVVQSGQELFRLIRKDRLEWRAELPAADLGRVKPEMPVRPASKAWCRGGSAWWRQPSIRKRGMVLSMSRLAAPAAGASAGMFASGEIETGYADVMTLPQSAVLLRDGYSYVFRIDKESRVIQTKVGVGIRVGERVRHQRARRQGGGR